MDHRSPNPASDGSAALYAFWKFSRPHTIIGTTLSVLGIFAIALSLSAAAGANWGAVVNALAACLCGNVYIVGLNQLEDVEIDRINKPHLPLASGEFSRRQGWIIVGLCGGLALALAAGGGPWLLATVGLSLLIGTAYSLPPIRLKRFPVWASLCIFSVRGAIVNLGLFLHFARVLELPGGIPVEVWALTLFILGFTGAIAFCKDIPDLEGDRRYHIRTFALSLGKRPVFRIVLGLISLCYVGMMTAAPLLSQASTGWLWTTHGLALGALWWQQKQVKLDDRKAIAQFYQFIWKLFFLEYLIFPVACWLAQR
ncbi:MAG: homogentisate phytyltransferase [Cyanobacteria bacterium J069]|nr:MAG: homogentisate phytyltransferase [Cyanobacteria bacterium J069]